MKKIIATRTFCTFFGLSVNLSKLSFLGKRAGGLGSEIHDIFVIIIQCRSWKGASRNQNLELNASIRY